MPLLSRTRYPWLLALLAVTACAPATPVSRTLADVCAPEMDGERVAVTAYLSYQSFMFCNEACPLLLQDQPGGPGVAMGSPVVWIPLKGETNSMYLPTKVNFGLEDIIVQDQDGKRLDLNQPVRIEATLALVDSGIEGREQKDCLLKAPTLTSAPALTAVQP